MLRKQQENNKKKNEWHKKRIYSAYFLHRKMAAHKKMYHKLIKVIEY